MALRFGNCLSAKFFLPWQLYFRGSQIRRLQELNIRSRHIQFFHHENIFPSHLFPMAIQCCHFHSSNPSFDLMEFFDDPKKWGEKEVKSGRSWRKDDLRIKSNSDLHKLWYVLLKEKNMLLTMEEAAKQEVEYFPNPERLDKVEESMENLEEVIRERNRAYFMLETGETGERPFSVKDNEIGLTFKYRMCEHSIPIWMNKSFKEKYTGVRDKSVPWFLRHLNEIRTSEKAFRLRRRRNHVRQLLKHFPNMDMEALREKYPEIDIEKLQRTMG